MRRHRIQCKYRLPEPGKKDQRFGSFNGKRPVQPFRVKRRRDLKSWEEQLRCEERGVRGDRV